MNVDKAQAGMVDKDVTTAIRAKPTNTEARLAELAEDLGSFCHFDVLGLPQRKRIDRSS
jgi:hypothetical protein